MSKIINAYTFGDMQAIYVLNEENNNPELVILPKNLTYGVNGGLINVKVSY